MKKEKLNIADNELLKKVKEKILEIEPEAEVYLFGSHARGDFNEESDWDFLIILPGYVNLERRSAIGYNTYPIEIEKNVIFNRIIHSKEDWLHNKIIHGSPFYDNVIHDAILL